VRRSSAIASVRRNGRIPGGAERIAITTIARPKARSVGIAIPQPSAAGVPFVAAR
jgi:hypothetical protein